MRKIILGTVLGLVIWGFAAPAAYSKLLDGPQRDAVPPTLDPGGGGYAVVHEDGHVCGVIAGNSYFANNDRVIGHDYMGCSAGSKIIFQMKQSPEGNSFGAHGPDVTYNNGVFTWGTTTIKDGIATDKDGRVWDTGSKAVIATAVVPPTSVPIWSPTQEPQQPAPAATQTVPAETPVVSQPVTTQTPVVSQPTLATTQFTQAPTSTPLVVVFATAAPTQSPVVDVVTVVGTASTSISSVSVTQKTQEEQKTLETQKDEGEWQPKRRSPFSGEQQAI